MNIMAIVLEYFPNASDDAVEAIALTCTPFPFSTDETVIRSHLQHYVDETDGSVQGAIDLAHQELDIAMSQLTED